MGGLLSYVQVAVDERPTRGRYVLSGSSNFTQLGAASQSLAGRAAVLQLLPLSFDELRRFPGAPSDVWSVVLSGGYPAVFDRGLQPHEWYSSYVATYVERDVRQLLKVADLTKFQTFVQLAAGRTAQLLNLSAFGADAGVTHVTAQAWVSVLETSHLVHRLPAWHANVTKRLVKTPKLHVLDSGLTCYLLGIRTPEQLRMHPLRGAIFESWVIAEILKARWHRGQPAALAYYRDRRGGEVDALLPLGERLLAVEVKSAATVAPDFFAALEVFAATARADPLLPDVERIVVYAGGERQRRATATVLPWADVAGHDWTGP